MILRFYQGAFSYKDLLELPYNTFMMFYDYMGYLINMETKEGQKRNRLEDQKLKAELGITTIDNDLNQLRNLFTSKVKK